MPSWRRAASAEMEPVLAYGLRLVLPWCYVDIDFRRGSEGGVQRLGAPKEFSKFFFCQNLEFFQGHFRDPRCALIRDARRSRANPGTGNEQPGKTARPPGGRKTKRL